VPYWSDSERVSRKKLIEDWNKGPNEKTKVQKGDELAHFRMGSTVILIFENLENIDLDSLNENMRVKFGDKLLSLKNI
jgi:phosphatidylserine decarboxylase